MPRVFHDPVAEPRGAARRRGGRTSVRPERPNSIRSPPPEFGKTESATAATSLGSRSAALDLNAGRSADRRRWVGAPLARARARIRRE